MHSLRYPPIRKQSIDMNPPSHISRNDEQSRFARPTYPPSLQSMPPHCDQRLVHRAHNDSMRSTPLSSPLASSLALSPPQHISSPPLQHSSQPNSNSSQQIPHGNTSLPVTIPSLPFSSSAISASFNQASLPSLTLKQRFLAAYSQVKINVLDILAHKNPQSISLLSFVLQQTPAIAISLLYHAWSGNSLSLDSAGNISVLSLFGMFEQSIALRSNDIEGVKNSFLSTNSHLTNNASSPSSFSANFHQSQHPIPQQSFQANSHQSTHQSNTHLALLQQSNLHHSLHHQSHPSAQRNAHVSPLAKTTVPSFSNPHPSLSVNAHSFVQINNPSSHVAPARTGMQLSHEEKGYAEKYPGSLDSSSLPNSALERQTSQQQLAGVAFATERHTWQHTNNIDKQMTQYHHPAFERHEEKELLQCNYVNENCLTERREKSRENKRSIRDVPSSCETESTCHNELKYEGRLYSIHSDDTNNDSSHISHLIRRAPLSQGSLHSHPQSGSISHPRSSSLSNQDPLPASHTCFSSSSHPHCSSTSHHNCSPATCPQISAVSHGKPSLMAQNQGTQGLHKVSPLQNSLHSSQCQPMSHPHQKQSLNSIDKHYFDSTPHSSSALPILNSIRGRIEGEKIESGDECRRTSVSEKSSLPTIPALETNQLVRRNIHPTLLENKKSTVTLPSLLSVVRESIPSQPSSWKGACETASTPTLPSGTLTASVPLPRPVSSPKPSPAPTHSSKAPHSDSLNLLASSASPSRRPASLNDSKDLTNGGKVSMDNLKVYGEPLIALSSPQLSPIGRKRPISILSPNEETQAKKLRFTQELLFPHEKNTFYIASPCLSPLSVSRELQCWNYMFAKDTANILRDDAHCYSNNNYNKRGRDYESQRICDYFPPEGKFLRFNSFFDDLETRDTLSGERECAHVSSNGYVLFSDDEEEDGCLFRFSTPIEA